MRRALFVVLLSGSLLAGSAPSPAVSGSGFERMNERWSHLHDYSMTIESHEVLGVESDEHEFWFAFKKPDTARLDIVSGSKSGATEIWNGGDAITAYRRAMSFFKKRGHVMDRDLTTLRGNGILMPNIGELIACFGGHREALREANGPTIDGEPTDEISLPYAGVECPDDSATDRHVVTLDVIDVSRSSGMPLVRTRYQGDAVVERWTMKDYKVDRGIDDGALR